MKISLEWLKRCLNFDKPAAEVDAAITSLGLEVESTTALGVAPNPLLVVGEVITKDKHPNADKLSVCTVDVGTGTPLQIVCGAQNFIPGDRVPVALVGCKLPGDFVIKKSKLRGVESEGMLCATDEIGLGGAHEGLMILSDRPAIGVPLHTVLSNDTIFEIKAWANRPDALSHRGVARDLAAKWGISLLPIPAPSFAVPSAASSAFHGVTVEDAAACPHYRAYTIRGVKVAPSPAWLQNLIKAIGLRPISNVVDITNFVLHTYGQPLHAFDLAKIEGAKLIVRRAKNGEKLITLDNKERTLDDGMLVIADANKPLVVAGIMGGQNAEVSATTTDIVLEAAHFNQTLIRKTGRKLALSSDSGQRYERGIDALGLQVAAERAVSLILEIAGGTLDGTPIVVGKPPYTPVSVEVSQAFIEDRLGFAVGADTIQKALTSFGFVLTPKGQGSWSVAVPSFRLDIERPIDLVEEVLRFIGVDKIPASVLTLPTVERIDDPLYTAQRTLAGHLVALGYNECQHYTLRTKPELERLVGASDAALHALANPLSADMAYMRASLIPGLCDALALNASRGNAESKFFEVGHTFRAHEGKLFEQLSIAFVKRLTPTPDRWATRAPSDFFSARAVIESLVAAAGLSLPAGDWSRLDAGSLWQPFHAAKLGCLTSSKIKLTAGLVALDTLKAAGVSGTVLAGELTLALDVFAAGSASVTTKRYTPFSAFPATRRDVAIIAPATASAGSVTATVSKLATAATAGKFAVESVTLFDRYSGKGVPEDAVSYAYALSFRSLERTLNDDEVKTAFNTVIEGLKQAGFSIRS